MRKEFVVGMEAEEGKKEGGDSALVPDHTSPFDTSLTGLLGFERVDL